MLSCAVIADDLTGGNAAGVLLLENGFASYTLLKLDRADEIPKDYVSVLYPTGSRAMEEKEAYKRVYHAASVFQKIGARLFAKRIDSTLRGNIGAELDGMLDALGDKYAAIVVPSFPKSGRTVQKRETSGVRDATIGQRGGKRPVKSHENLPCQRNIRRADEKEDVFYF